MDNVSNEIIELEEMIMFSTTISGSVTCDEEGRCTQTASA